MSNFPVSAVQNGFFQAKLPSRNKAMGFTHDERAKNGMRGLYPGGIPFTLDQKVEVSNSAHVSVVYRMRSS